MIPERGDICDAMEVQRQGYIYDIGHNIINEVFTSWYSLWGDLKSFPSSEVGTSYRATERDIAGETQAGLCLRGHAMGQNFDSAPPKFEV